MCGIVGLIGYGDISLVSTMNKAQAHRGPDGGGVFADVVNRVFLAMQRLSIVDLTGGDQPMANDDKTVWIVFNGEIYNAPELRETLQKQSIVFRSNNSDTEVLLRLYERFGSKMLNYLNGMFAFVIYDSRHSLIFGARDHFGIKPLYYKSNAQGLAFASELKSLALIPGFLKELNKQSLYHYLSFQCIPSPNSIFKDVFKLSPGEFFLYDVKVKNLSKHVYWQPTARYINCNVESMSHLDVQHEIREGLTRAVRRWMLSDVPLGCSLSGGIDSAIVTGLMSEYSDTKIRTYTLGFEDSLDLDERFLARAVARRFETIHQEIVIRSSDLLTELDAMVTSLDEPYSGGLPSWFVYKHASKDVKVCMSGIGGDEIFGNYGKWRVYENLFLKLRRIGGILRRDISSFENIRQFSRGALYHLYFRANEKKNILNMLELDEPLEESEALVEGIWDSAEADTARDAVRTIDMRIQLPEEFLHMADRFSMAFSVEARTPFLDREFAQRMIALRSENRFDNKELKKHLIAAMSNYIPKELREAKKRGFVLPLEKWIRENLREEIESLFNPSFIKNQGIFRERIYQDLLIPHLRGTQNNSAKIWTIYMFQKWYQQNFYN